MYEKKGRGGEREREKERERERERERKESNNWGDGWKKSDFFLFLWLF